MNRSDSERLRTVLKNIGYSEASSELEEDVTLLGILACSVRQKAIDRVYGKIRNWNRLKNTKPLITFITGCILPDDRKKFLRLFDLVFPVDQLTTLPEMLQQYGTPTPASLQGQNTNLGIRGKKIAGTHSVEIPALDQASRVEVQERMENFWHIEPGYSSRIEAYIPIQNGCDKFCSFCAVPYTRGREVSRNSGEILAEITRLVEQGYKSITLLGQNVNAYGLDRPGKELTFPRLMQAIGEMGRTTAKYFRVYFTSPHPKDFTTELLEIMAEYPVLAKWIHLPLQSGDDKILLRMNRNHTMERYRSVVSKIRHFLPTTTLFTDIIVGFTGETEEQFQATANAMREFRYNMAYIASYSPRPGARSSRWIDDVDRLEKERRYQILSKLLTEIGKEIHSRYIGQSMKVLITSSDKKSEYLSGYTEGRIPVRIKAPESAIGEYINTRITSARPLSLEGESETE